MLTVKALRPLKHYFPKDLMSFGRRLWIIYHEGRTFVIKDKTIWNEIQDIKRYKISRINNIIHSFYNMNLNIKT
jgi:DNA-directed RNA polymerase delta subunit